MSSVFGLEATGKENNLIQVQVSYINPSNIAIGFLENHRKKVRFKNQYGLQL